MSRKHPRVRFTAFESLSPEGKGVVLQALREDWTQRRIQEELEARTGETISNGSLGRFVGWWRQQEAQEKEAQAFAQRTIRAMKDGGVQAVDYAEALTLQALLENVDEADNIDLETSLKLQHQYAELRQKERSAERQDKQRAADLELRREKLGVLERQLELKRERCQFTVFAGRGTLPASNSRQPDTGRRPTETLN